MTLRTGLATAALVALIPLAAGCGGGSKNAAKPLPPTPTLTVPGQSGTPSVPTRSTSTTTSATTSTAAAPTQTAAAPSNPSTPAGGAAPPSTGGATAGGGTSGSGSPPSGSPAQQFSQFCKDNPGAC